MPASPPAKRKPIRSRIVVVDDHRLATQVLAKLLRRHGYEVAEENDPRQALALARRFKPDLLILDVNMPWKSGYDLAADLAADEVLCHVPIILMTADVVAHRASTSLLPILSKPFSIEDLFACIRKALAAADS